MRKPQPISKADTKRLFVLLRDSESKQEYQRIQAVWMRATLGLSSDQIAVAIGWHPSSVKRIQAQYLKEKEKALNLGKRGGRYRQNLSIDDEERLLKGFFEKASAGGILVVSEIKEAYEEKIGRRVPKSTIYRMLTRHSWRKIAPRGHHPQVDPDKQEAFKKSLVE